jgi:hypothetical protein
MVFLCWGFCRTTTASPQKEHLLSRTFLVAAMPRFGKFPVKNGTDRHLSLLAACGGERLVLSFSKESDGPLHQSVLRSSRQERKPGRTRHS